MAHQWFGDLVTNEWWSEIMLHESMARYFDTFAPHEYPQPISFTDPYYVQVEQERLLQYDSDLGNIRPFIVPDGSFDAITYDKGACLMRMLSAALGKDVFQLGLQNYLKKFQLGNANHTQFFDELTKVCQKVRGKGLR